MNTAFLYRMFVVIARARSLAREARALPGENSRMPRVPSTIDRGTSFFVCQEDC